jgi:hypothetical protein
LKVSASFLLTQRIKYISINSKWILESLWEWEGHLEIKNFE